MLDVQDAVLAAATSLRLLVRERMDAKATFLLDEEAACTVR